MKGSSFQLIIIIVFVAAGIFGILVFSGVIPIGNSNSNNTSGTVVLWGTIKKDTMNPLINEFNKANTTFTTKYVEKSADTFDQDLLEALATGTGPDLFFLPDNLAFHYSNKITVIHFQSFPLANFKNTFASAGEVFLTSKGLLAFPLSIDPLMMYYNRSILDAHNVVSPPVFWDDLSALISTLTEKDNTNKITKSAVALGHFSNVMNAKEILIALFMQTGNKIVVFKDGFFNSVLGASGAKTDASTVLQFYTDFANPLDSSYSWNKSFPNSRDVFSAEKLAFYFGFASELPSLINKNPNQNFFVSAFPQIKNSNFKLTGAQVTGIAISSSSKNFNTAFTAASLMATGNFAGKFALALGLAPARRDLLAVKPADAYSPIFYNSALFARSWLDPSDIGTDDIFRRMVDSVLANNMTPAGAIQDASGKLNLLLMK